MSWLKSFSLLFVAWLCLLAEQVFAQERLILPLTEFFTPAESGSKSHVYNNLVTVTTQGELLERMYTLENHLVKVTKSTYKDAELQELLRREIQNFTKEGELEYVGFQEIFDNGFTIKVADEQQLILDITCTEANNCAGVFIPIGSSEALTVRRNVFEANFENLDVWTDFVVENVRYPAVAKKGNHQGVVHLALKVDAEGNFVASFPINPKEVHKSLVEELQRVVALKPGRLLPAMNKYGEPKEGWIYFSFDFTF